MNTPDIKLFELEPTRSSRARWALLEAGLDYESIGNRVEIIGSDELLRVHPLGKLPAAIIDGKPLFESAAIVTAVADLVPDRDLIAKPNTWERNLHYQWLSYAISEMEAFLQSSEINTIDFILPESQRVPEIVEQNSMLFKKGAAVLEDALGTTDFLVGNHFSATDIFVGYTIYWGQEQALIGEFPNLLGYLDRLLNREHCTLHQVTGS